MSELAVACLCVILATPIASGQGTFICTPAAFITVAVLFIRLIELSLETVKELENGVVAQKVPELVVDCVESNAPLVVPDLAAAQRELSELGARSRCLVGL